MFARLAANHQARAGDCPSTMGLHNGLIDLNGSAKIIRDQEQLARTFAGRVAWQFEAHRFVPRLRSPVT
jgi:hypothetical protein